jgi:hypothetical protein
MENCPDSPDTHSNETKRMKPFLSSLAAGVTLFALQTALVAQVGGSDTDAQLKNALQLIERLASQVAAQDARIAAQDARIKDLEAARGGSPPAASTEKASISPPVNESTSSVAAEAKPATQDLKASESQPSPTVESASQNTPTADKAQTQDMSTPGHDMSLPYGPTLNIRGFFDFNFGVGSIANPLVFPIIDNGCGTCGFPPTPPHSTFQAGEFDLFFTSKLSDRLSFLAEVVLGPDTTNEFNVDIERYQLTYKWNRYFTASAGRFHTSIGYYNTAYHHGNWFSTAEGRPIMYLFEDSGGILPVHMVGVTFTGEVPHTEKLGLHWIAEVGNGLSSNSSAEESVQNFYSDRNYKATNLAAYIRPDFLSGLQIGGSWYHDGLSPVGLPEVRQNIESAYIVYFSPVWEFMNEAVLLSNHLMGMPESFRSPMAYTQLARKFGRIYKPYFRYQYVRDSLQDPVNLLKGTYYGPSIGVRIDFADYAAFKLQFDHLFQSSQLAGNGLNAQIAFTF